MRKLIYIILFLMFSLILAANEPKWYSFDEGYKLAAKENKIILIDFYTDWCGWCKKMDKDTYSNNDIAELLNKDFVTIKINPEKAGKVTLPSGELTNRQLGSELGIRSYPSTAFFTSDFQLIEVIPGYYEPDAMKTLLNFMSGELYQKISFQDYRLFEQVKKLSEDKNSTPQIDFVLGYFYLIFFDDKDKAHTNFQSALENKLNNKELYAALSLSAPAGSTKIDEWSNKAKSLGYSDQSELNDLVIKYVKEIYSASQ